MARVPTLEASAASATLYDPASDNKKAGGRSDIQVEAPAALEASAALEVSAVSAASCNPASDNKKAGG